MDKQQIHIKPIFIFMFVVTQGTILEIMSIELWDTLYKSPQVGSLQSLLIIIFLLI